MSKSILVVDDEAKIRRMVARYLKENNYTVYEAADGVQALQIVENETVDLVILDLMMPRMDGEGFIKAIRQFSDVYVIVLTAKTGEDSQVDLYGSGADDYVEKPFSCKALMSKVSAVINRLDRKAYGKNIVHLDGLNIDNIARTLSIDSLGCNLKPKEFDLLQYLMRNQNFALSRDQLLNGVWGEDYFGADRTVDIHISRLRKKLGAYGKHIHTMSNFGYKWEVKE
ncbi:MAG: response regulator transcription factor [Peptococcaceae bacterium]|jgi:DNA-binding response OmpR family regulator|nr:response regulator transcription factor [Peptococcaceae bacterium]